MYMYEENFKRNIEDITLSDAVANASGVVPESYQQKAEGEKSAPQPVEMVVNDVADYSEQIPVTVESSLTVKKACVIAALILVASAVAVFFILHGGGVI